METILICDDEKDIVSALQIYLKAEGYRTLCAYTGRQALDIMHREPVQLVLMDIMMPEMDGITAMTEIRSFSNVPVILLTAKSEDSDKIIGLNVGADDYITKPFLPLEVVARVKSQLRRYLRLGSAIPQDPDHLIVGSISMDTKGKTVMLDGEPINLTPTEFAILELMMKSPGTVFAPKDIFQAIRNENPVGAENIIAVHIRHLREKLEINPGEPRYIKVIWGQGYKLERQ